MKPLISILIPAYNAGPWVGATIRSALAQTWPHKEIIVVDDGSTDATLSTACEFAASGVTVISQANQGGSAARNTAYAASKGDYIQWLDADDLLDPEKISKQMGVLHDQRGSRTLLSASWGEFYYRVGKAKFAPNPLWKNMTPREFMLCKMQDGFFMQTATWLVSRELSEAAGPWNTKLAYDDDGEYFCRVMLASETIRFVPESKVYYRNTDSTRVSYVGRSHKKLEAQFYSMQLHIAYLRSLDDDARTKKASLCYLQRYCGGFYLERPDIFRQMEELAVELGGTLAPPRVRPRYYWIQKMFGLNAANRVHFFLSGVRTAFLQTWDKLMYRLERSKPAT